MAYRVFLFHMGRLTPLDKQWDELMVMCRREAEFKVANSHPKLLDLLSREIDQLAHSMGFDSRLIALRQFRAEREGSHIVRVLTDFEGSRG